MSISGKGELLDYFTVINPKTNTVKPVYSNHHQDKSIMSKCPCGN